MEKKIYIDGKETNYIVSSEGKVFNSITKRELKGTIQRNEYHSVQLTINKKPKTVMVHRLVAEAFLDNPNNFNIVDHIDQNKMNNNVTNLRWVNSKTNSMNTPERQNIQVGRKVDLSQIDLEEEWRIIKEFAPQYRINKNGEIINLKTQRYIIGSERNGYKRISINNKSYSIHRLVWETFNGEIPSDKIIDHIDGNKSNNKLENLRLATQSENVSNAQQLGHKGQKGVAQCTLDGKEIKTFISIQQAADDVGVTHGAIRSAIIRKGTSKGFKWKFIE